ncbi:TorF family putative porin [Thiohalophilus thiocyanatoxydans]|uniref:TorF family putative porin n=1 Tax=Thiohalophilus thiocyanatoxydans TaxID=381308 RepID=UPI001AB03B56|nr:TorF family putative porin [Thiohalophilus thiocyanatoxydans]
MTTQPQGGIDYTHETNLYAGVWTANYGNGNGYESDLYGGFRGSAAGIPLDAGMIMYRYPVASRIMMPPSVTAVWIVLRLLLWRH